MVTSKTFPEATSPFEVTPFSQVLQIRTAPCFSSHFLMNLHHVLSLTLLDEHVYGTCHTKWKVPTQESELTLYCLQYETQIQLEL